MNLLEPPLEPVQLGPIDGAVSPARVADSVQRDQAHDPHVVHVVRESIVHVLGRETVPTAAYMRVDELAPRDRPALLVRRHLDCFTRHELLGMIGEGLHRVLGIQALRRPDRFAPSCHRRLERACDDADPLAHLLVIAVATQPRNTETLRCEWLY